MEIQTQLEKEEIDVYALTETHLRDMEEPPVMDDYVWVGCNRAAGERKGGGVGMLIRRGGNWQRENQGCKEHLWVSGTVGGKRHGWEWPICGQGMTPENKIKSGWTASGRT